MSGETSRRKRSPFWLAALVACAAGTGLAAGWAYLAIAQARNPGAPSTGPHLEKWASAARDLGEGKPGEVLSGSFLLRNTGTEPLAFHIVAICACARLEPREGSVAPGESVEVVAGVRLRHEGSREHVRLQVTTNDPQEPVAEYTLHARCPAPFELTPQTIDFGDVSVGASPEIRLLVRDGQGNPLKPDGVRIEAPTNPLVSVLPEMRGEEFVAVVRLSGSAPHGHLSAEFKLRAADGERAMNVPVTAHVLPLVLAAPRTLELRSAADGQGSQGDFLVWRTDGAPLGKLLGVDSPPSLSVTALGDGGKRQRFRVRAEGARNGADLLHVRMRFDSLPERIAVDVRLPACGPQEAALEKQKKGRN